jgi:uncharacterized protein YjbJ (UPF0337 family)
MFQQVPQQSVRSFWNRARNSAAGFTLAVLDSLKTAEMDSNRIEENSKEAKGKIKRKWGQLTDDDLAQINGRRDQLKEGSSNATAWLKILAKDLARKDVDDWLDAQP